MSKPRWYWEQLQGRAVRAVSENELCAIKIQSFCTSGLTVLRTRSCNRSDAVGWNVLFACSAPTYGISKRNGCTRKVCRRYLSFFREVWGKFVYEKRKCYPPGSGSRMARLNILKPGYNEATEAAILWSAVSMSPLQASKDTMNLSAKLSAYYGNITRP